MNKYKVIFTDGDSIEIIATNESEARYKATMKRTQPIRSIAYIGI